MYALYAFIYFCITSRMTKAAKSYDNFLSHVRVSKREIVHTMEGKSTLALKVRDSDRERGREREKGKERDNSDR